MANKGRFPLPLAALLPTHPLLTSSERFYAWLRIFLPILSLLAIVRGRDSRSFFSTIQEDSVLTLLSPKHMGTFLSNFIDFGTTCFAILGCIGANTTEALCQVLGIEFEFSLGQLKHMIYAAIAVIIHNCTETHLRQLTSITCFIEFFRSLLRPRVTASRISSPRLSSMSRTGANSEPENQRLRSTSLWAAKRRYLFAVYAIPALIHVVLEFGALAVKSISIMDGWVHKHIAETVKDFIDDKEVSLWDSMGYETMIVLLGIAGFVPVWTAMWWTFVQLTEAERDLEIVRSSRAVKKVRWEAEDVDIPMPKLNLAEKARSFERSAEEIILERRGDDRYGSS